MDSRCWLWAAVAASSMLWPQLGHTQALPLDEAVSLALSEQPKLAAASAETEAARQQRDAAGRLPDPQLIVGLNNLSLDQPNPYRDQAERMTSTSLGWSQGIPSADKRRQQRRRADAALAVADSGLDATRRQVVRDTALAWISRWYGDEALLNLQHQREALQQLVETLETAYVSDTGNPDALYRERVRLAQLDDRLLALRQQRDSAQAMLARWIGDDAADRPAAAAPEPRPLPAYAQALETLSEHPRLRENRQRANVAEAEVALARADYRPDWRVQASYGYREPYDDMISLQLGIDLPVFTRHRQDRGLAAAEARELAAQSRTEDLQRTLVAELRDGYAQVDASRQRLQAYDRDVLPAAQRRSEAALARYRSGDDALVTVLSARLSVLELTLNRLALQAEWLRSDIRVRYLIGDTP